MKKVSLVSLGCEKNLVDSEHILGLLQHDGYEITNSLEDSDIIFVNTCGFITPSKKESIEAIFNALSLGKQVVVTGCLVQRYEENLKKEIPEANYIAIRDYDHFNELLSKIDPNLTEKGGLKDEYRIVSSGDFSAYLRIGDGCDNCCTYCAIPLIRGKYQSRKYDDIINEAKELALRGYKELIVLEQDTTKYGSDLSEGHNIVSLLKGLLKIEELDYIRLLYLYPDEISNELIELIASEERLTPYFDIPIQHSESHILKAMNRRGDKEFLLNLFKKIKEKVPNAILRTTIMVGFPGESEEDVDNLIDFINEVQFDHLGVFTYSKEEGTKSYNFPNQIKESVKNLRKRKVMKAQQVISYRKNKSQIGKEMTGLVIGTSNKYYLFRSYWNAPDGIDGNIYIKSDKILSLGEKITVKITDASVYDLYGEIL